MEIQGCIKMGGDKNTSDVLSDLEGRSPVGRAGQVVAVHLPVAHICCGLPWQGVVQPVHVHRVVHDAPVGHRPDGAGVGPPMF